MANTYNNSGVASVVFGIPAAVTGYVIQASTISSKCNVEAKVENETGQIVVRRYDDIQNELTLDAIINGATPPSPGAEFTWNSAKYEVQATDTKWTNKDYSRVSIKGVNSANVTDP